MKKKKHIGISPEKLLKMQEEQRKKQIGELIKRIEITGKTDLEKRIRKVMEDKKYLLLAVQSFQNMMQKADQEILNGINEMFPEYKDNIKIYTTEHILEIFSGKKNQESRIQIPKNIDMSKIKKGSG